MSARPLLPWKTRARTPIIDRSPWLRLWSEDVELPDGRVVTGFNTIEMPDVAVVVALTPDGDVIVERNYKHGAGRVCLNLPAGYVESGEEPLTAARRELLEETGYAATGWVPLGAFAGDGNRGCGTNHLFLARGARQTGQPDTAGDLEETQVILMPLDSLVQAMRKGEIGVLSIAAATSLAMLAERESWPALP